MKNKALNYALLGVFVIAMLASAIGATVALSGRGGSHDEYVITFDNVADVKFGTLVRYEGYPVGQVEEILPVTQGNDVRFDIRVSVQSGWKIPSDSVATIGSSKFLGAKTVDIRRGNSDTALVPGTKIASAPPTDMYAAMSSIAGDFGDLSRNGLTTMVERMTALLEHTDTMVRNDVGNLVRSMNALTDGLKTDIPQITGRLNATVGSVQAALSDRNVETVQTALQNVETVSEQFVEIGSTLREAVKQINLIATDVDRMIKSNEGHVSGSLKDAQYLLHSLARNIDNFNHNISGTARNMNEFSRLIRQNPSLLLGGTPQDELKTEPVSAPVTGSRNR